MKKYGNAATNEELPKELLLGQTEHKLNMIVLAGL
jgi:hypothetical protein